MALSNSQFVNGDKEVEQALETIRRKSAYATAYALTGLAFDIRSETRGRLPGWVNLTRNFLPNSVVYDKATVNNLVATVGFDKRAYFAPLLEKGGVRHPTGGRAIAIPIDVRLNKKGGISDGNRPKNILMKPNVFVAKSRSGTAGIWQKMKRVPMKLLYLFKRNTHYRMNYIHFYQTAQQVVAAKAQQRFSDAIMNQMLR